MAQRVGFEGNIGAGKTSLIKLVAAQAPGRFRFYPEPLDEWEALGNVLEGFYAGEPGSGFLAQTLISQTLLRRDIPRTRCLREIGLYERSLMSARQCFIPAMLAQSQLRSVEADILVGMKGRGVLDDFEHLGNSSLFLELWVQFSPVHVASSKPAEDCLC